MDRPDTNIPQVPEGYSRPTDTPQNFAGSSNQNGGKPQPFGAPTYTQGFVLCVIGGVITGLMSFIGSALVAYGMVIAVYCKKGRGWFGPAIASVLVTGVVAYLMSGPTETATSVTACALALGVGYAFATEKLTVGVGSLLVGASALALLGYDAFFAAMAGTSLPELAQSVFNQYASQVTNATPDIQEGLATAKALFMLFWPTSYTSMALLYFVIARFGAQTVYKALTRDPQKLPQFQLMDVPFWICALAVVNLFVYALSSTILSAQDILQLITLNVFMALRIVFALQGLAVLTWFVREKHFSPALSLSLFVLAGMLEVQLGVMALVGLIDAWANFRKLNRSGNQDSEPTINNN